MSTFWSITFCAYTSMAGLVTSLCATMPIYLVPRDLRYPRLSFVGPSVPNWKHQLDNLHNPERRRYAIVEILCWPLFGVFWPLFLLLLAGIFLLGWWAERWIGKSS